ANGSRPLPTNAQAHLRVVQGPSSCATRRAAARAQPKATRPLRLLRPQGQSGSVRIAAALRRAGVVAMVTPPLAARSHLGGDDPTAAALPAADAGPRAPRVAKPCLEEPDAGNLHV